MYSLGTRIAPAAQALDVPMDLLPPFAEMLLPEDFHAPAPEDLTVDHRFWQARAEQFEENMTRGAIIHAWRIGLMSSGEAIQALIIYDALDYELAMQLLSDHAMVAEKLMSPVEVPASGMGRVL
jgi:hypothetical protein